MTNVADLLKDGLRARIEALRGEWSEDDVRVGLEVTVDYAQLKARAAAGEEVDPEALADAEAAVKNLGAATAVSGARVVNETIGDVIGVLSKLIVGAVL